jgi:RecA/RadA recombinase
MAAAPEKLAALRHLLAERFPTVPVGSFDAHRAGRVLPTGIPTLDDITGGGLPLSAVTEIICAAPSCGSHLLVGRLLAATRATRLRLALIDSADSFDPSSFSEDLLAHLVWVRCAGTTAALNAADLLARDANLGLVVLDLRRAPEAELRRTPSTQWYRLQRAVEATNLALVGETPRAAVPSAQLRLLLGTPHDVSALDRERAKLTAHLAPTLSRQRLQTAG